MSSVKGAQSIFKVSRYGITVSVGALSDSQPSPNQSFHGQLIAFFGRISGYMAE